MNINAHTDMRMSMYLFICVCERARALMDIYVIKAHLYVLKTMI